MAAKGKAKVREARVEIVLTDGTRVSARGPMADQMARRLLDQPVRWWYPGTWGGYSATYTSTGLNTGCTLETASGGVVQNASVAQIESALKAGLNS